MSRAADSSVPAGPSQLSFASEIFHKLSQPVTALQCWLELSLVRDQTVEEFRTSVEAALLNAERLRQSLLLLRELNDADDPGDTSVPVPLQELLHELQEDFLPVCESAGGCFHVTCRPLQVRGNRAKLRRAFFCLLECLLRSCCRRSLTIRVKRTKRRQAEIRMTLADAALPAQSTDEMSKVVSGGEVDVARRTFRAVGGDLVSGEPAGGQRVLIVTLLLAA